MIIDTHAHLDFPDFAEDFDAVLERAAVAGVDRVITIGTTLESSRRAVELAERHSNVFAAVGIHPGNADEAPLGFIDDLRKLACSPRVVALGECGLDYHRLPGEDSRMMWNAMGAPSTEVPGNFAREVAVGVYKRTQAIVFEQQLDLAAELGLNMVIHERDAWDDTVALLHPYQGRLRAVFHCFGKSIDHANDLISQNHLVSFTGIVTFKNGREVQATAAAVAGDAFMVETDCPYLAPVPNRGKRCEPAHTRLVAEKIAELRGETLDQIAARTTATAEAFFRFPK